MSHIHIEKSLTPSQIVKELDRHIIGQSEAKRSVAIALRNRWRRMQLPQEMRNEITPKNILMIGPTGVGKTEIARRLAKLSNAPFIKVEATKFTEVGYVGRDVETIIRDLVETGFKMLREQEMEACEEHAKNAAIERVLDVLLTPARNDSESQADKPEDSATRVLFRKKVINGEMDDKEIEIDVTAPQVGVEIMAPPGMEDMTSQIQNMFSNLGQGKSNKRKMKVKDALKVIQDEEAHNMINMDELKAKAVEAVEQNGIVFIDEIDKVAKRQEAGGGDVSREGVQRDLLPLIEGCTVSTKYGMLKTDHILFVASGAFHLSKPSDLIPELQGRLPIRVELQALTPDDFKRILTEPTASLTEQYKALLSTEGLNVEFTEDGIEQLAQTAFKVNETTENIGARRLHTMMERLLEKVSFEAENLATQYSQQALQINGPFVNEHLDNIAQDEDLSRFIL